MHLVGFTIGIYHDARSPERQTEFPLHILVLCDVGNYIEKTPYKEATSHQVHS